MRGFRKLVLYNKSKELVLLIYKTTSKFPKTETFTLVPQMRRAAVSVMANIIEGYSRESSKEYARFLTISIASLTELEVFVELSYELKFINRRTYEGIQKLIIENKKLLYRSRKTIRKRAYDQ